MKGKAVQSFVGVPTSDTFGSRLKQLREHAGLSRKQFADKSGLDEKQIYRFETQGQFATKNESPSCDALARMFHVQPAWPFAGSMVPKAMWPEWWRPQ